MSFTFYFNRFCKQKFKFCFCIIPCLFSYPAFAIEEGLSIGAGSIAAGEDSIATGNNSQAIGTNAIATGGNIDKESFMAELDGYKVLLEQLAVLQEAINQKEGDIAINQSNQNAIMANINNYNQLLAQAEEKLANKNLLTQEKSDNQNLLSTHENELDTINTNFSNNNFISGDKKSYLNFINVIDQLDWSKLQQTGGRDLLAQDLKEGLSSDFGDLSTELTDQDYLDFVNSYINNQGTYAYSKERIINDFVNSAAYQNNSEMKSRMRSFVSNFENSLNKHNKTYQDQFSIDRLLIYANDNNSIYHEKSFYAEDNNIPQLELLPLPNIDIITATEEEILAYNAIRDENNARRTLYDETYGYQANLDKRVASLTNISLHKKLLDDPNSKLHSIKQNYHINNNPVYASARHPGSNYGDNVSITRLPPVNAFVHENELYSVTKGIKFGINRIIQRGDNINNISLDEINDLKQQLDQYSSFLNKIDFSSDNWLLDKDQFQVQYEKSVAHYNKMRLLSDRLLELGNVQVGSPEHDAIVADIILLRKEIKEQHELDKDNLESSFILDITRNTKWTNEVLQLAEMSKNELLPKLDDIRQNLSQYDRDNNVVQTVKNKVESMADEISVKKQQISDTEALIADLEAQIQAIELSPEEVSAADNRAAALEALEIAKQEKELLEQDLEEKRNELLGIDQQMQSSPLGSKGSNAIANGTNAFASGKDSIAIGTDAIATADNAIALGNKSNARGENSVAIGNEAQSLKAGAVAIGNKAIANGVKAIAIGENAGVSGEKSIGIGADSIVQGANSISLGTDNIVTADNAVAIGSNITKTAQNSVNLGNASAAETTLTEQTAGTTTYAHSELLGEIYTFAGAEASGVVSVGDVGKERRVQNVSAGLIALGSTDAINGSQLYSVITAVDSGALGLVKQDPKSGVITIGGQSAGNEVSFVNGNGELRRLSGIAEGLKPYDAINKQQFDRSLGIVNRRIDTVEKNIKDIKGSTAAVVAMANMPTASMPGQSYFSAGTGYANGTSAISVGLSRVSDNGRISYKISGGASQAGNFTAGAGIGIAW